MMGEAASNEADEIQKFLSLPEKERIWKDEFNAILSHTATTAELLYPWDIYRELLKSRLLHIVTEENERSAQAGRALNPDAINLQLQMIGKSFQCLKEAPFTMQRLCELAMFPGNGQHKSVDKYLRAVEKVLCVFSSYAEFENATPIPEPDNVSIGSDVENDPGDEKPSAEET